jgi:23S rRNA pseudouridine2604 synthase
MVTPKIKAAIDTPKARKSDRKPLRNTNQVSPQASNIGGPARENSARQGANRSDAAGTNQDFHRRHAPSSPQEDRYLRVNPTPGSQNRSTQAHTERSQQRQTPSPAHTGAGAGAGARRQVRDAAQGGRWQDNDKDNVHHGRGPNERRQNRPYPESTPSAQPFQPPTYPRQNGSNQAFGEATRAQQEFGAEPFRQDHRRATSTHHSAQSRRHEDPLQSAPGSMRLSKRMSELGMASRREADEWIPRGWVRVDGKVAKELGSRVVVGQHITIDARARNQQAARVTVLIHKPVGYVSGQAEDGYEPALVLVTPQNQWREDRSGIAFLREHLRNLAPAGRLDIDSVGLLVLTQDGRVAKQLIGQDSEVEKEYLVRVQTQTGEALPDSSLALLNHGLELDGQALRPAHVEWVNDDQLRFVLQEGRKRQIRRMCEAVGLNVSGLKRVRIGQVMLADLPVGCWRYLRSDETFVEVNSAEPATK